MTDYIPPPSTLPPGATVWAYLRDSGGMSQEQSVSQQREAIKTYCAQHQLIIAHLFTDEAKSAGSVIGRDAFNDMIDLSRDPDLRPAGLLLWNFARFARDLDDSSYNKAIIRKQKIIIHSLTDPIPAGEWGRVIETVIDISNEEKRRQNSRDVKRALQALTRQGFSCGGFPPRGYKAEPVIIGTKRDGQPRKVSRWIEDPQTWELAKIAWAMRAEGKTYDEIRQACRGLFTAKTSYKSFFENKTYLGVGKCGDLEIPDHHPPMIDLATWEAVRRLEDAAPKRKRSGQLHHPRRVGAPSLLSGLAVCIHCGAAIFKGNRKEYHYYICGKKSRHGYSSCPNRMITASNAERAILDAVTSRVFTSDLVNALIVEVQAQLSDTAALDRQIEAIKKQIGECERAIQNLYELAETFGARAAGEKIKEREAEQDRLKYELLQIEAKRKAGQIEITPEVINTALLVWRNELESLRNKNDVIALRNFVMRFVNKIELGYNTARIWYSYPLEDLTSSKGTLPRGGTKTSD